MYCKSVIQENPGMRILFETKSCGLGGVFYYPTQSHYHPGKDWRKYSFILYLKSQMWRTVGVFPPLLSFLHAVVSLSVLMTIQYWQGALDQRGFFIILYLTPSLPGKMHAFCKALTLSSCNSSHCLCPIPWGILVSKECFFSVTVFFFF